MAMKFEKVEEGLFSLDVQGYACPHPQLYTKKALSKLKSGDVLQVIFDNPSSSESISGMCENSADAEIIDKIQESGKFSWKIKKV